MHLLRFSGNGPSSSEDPELALGRSQKSTRCAFLKETWLIWRQEYRDAQRAYNDLGQVLATYPGFTPRTDVYSEDDPQNLSLPNRRLTQLQHLRVAHLPYSSTSMARCQSAFVVQHIDSP